MIKLLELFGGIGSPRKALENIGVSVKSIDYVDFNERSTEAYNLLFDESYNSQDIKKWSNPDISVDILFHGPPCQDFSTAGKNDLSKGRSILYLRSLEIIEKELKNKPKVVILENVKGLLCEKNINHFNHYLKSMESLGYTNHYKVLNSKDFGIPQSRNRVFIVSILKGQTLFNNEFNFENLETKPMKTLYEFLESGVKDSIKLSSEQWSKLTLCGRPTLRGNMDAIRLRMPTKNFTNFIIIPRASDGKLINGSHNRIWKLDKYIGTIAASANTKIMIPIIENSKVIYTNVIFVIEKKPYYIRKLTPRECWRLMGFKDKDIDKVIHLPKSHLYEMAGNAIVIPVLEAIFKELFKGAEVNE